MTYSEAIRMGGVLSTHLCKGILFDGLGGSCANGGAALAAGFVNINKLVDWAKFKAWPVATKTYWRCPYGCLFTARQHGATVVAHLNDKHGCTRDQIADWVAEQERKLAPEGAVVPGVAEGELEFARRVR